MFLFSRFSELDVYNIRLSFGENGFFISVSQPLITVCRQLVLRSDVAFCRGRRLDVPLKRFRPAVCRVVGVANPYLVICRHKFFALHYKPCRA